MDQFAGVVNHELTIDDQLVAQARSYVLDHVEPVACLVHRIRCSYRDVYDQDVATVTAEQVTAAVNELFNDYPRALNVSCLLALAFLLKGTEDYEVFVVDEFLGVALAETIAGGEPNRSFARGNFHVYDITMKAAIDECFGQVDTRLLAVDDALLGLAAGLEAVIPGWDWMTRRGRSG